MPNKTNGIEALIDLFIAELLRTLDRFGDLETTIDIHRIASQSIAALAGVQAKAQDQARIYLEQLDPDLDGIEADNGFVSRQKAAMVDEKAWLLACQDIAICRDAQVQLKLALGRVERLQASYGCRVEGKTIYIQYKGDN